MKKQFVVLMALLLVFALCGCGKSEAVTNVETLISQLGTIHLEDSEKIAEAREAYDALSEEEAAMVENIATLVKAENRLLELMLMGDWRYEPAEYADIRQMYDVVDLTLRNDMTVTGSYVNGTWYVDDAQLCIDNGESISVYEILVEDMMKLVTGENTCLIRTADMNAKLDMMFTFVDLTAENIDIYCDLVEYTEEELDKFGTPTGNYTTRITFASKVVEEGLLYFGNEDVVVELNIPEHEFTKSKGTKNFKYTEKKGTCDLSGCIFGDHGYAVEFFDADEMKVTHKVTSGQVTVGRVKGTLIFVNSDFVQAVEVSNGSRYLLMDNGTEVYTGNWYEGLLF